MGAKFVSIAVSVLCPVDWIVVVALLHLVICGLVYFMLVTSFRFKFPIHSATTVTG